MVARSERGSTRSVRLLLERAAGVPGCETGDLGFVDAEADFDDVFEVARDLRRGWRYVGARDGAAVIAN